MEPTIAVYFDYDRTYVALLEPDPKFAYSLAYINSTERPIDFNGTVENAIASQGLLDLNDIMAEIGGAASRITVAMTMECAIVHTFPIPEEATRAQIRQMLNMEINQNYPQFEKGQFRSRVYTLPQNNKGKDSALATITDKMTPRIPEIALLPLNGRIDRMDMAQFTAHDAYCYNYPELASQTVALFGIYHKFWDLSVVRDGKIATYISIMGDSVRDFGGECESYIQKIIETHVPFIDAAYFFGSGLTSARLSDATAKMSVPVHRLNALRMLSTSLGERERDYCSRVAHILPSCIGSAVSPMNIPMEL